jgi:hypothetical protein
VKILPFCFTSPNCANLAAACASVIPFDHVCAPFSVVRIVPVSFAVSVVIVQPLAIRFCFPRHLAAVGEYYHHRLNMQPLFNRFPQDFWKSRKCRFLPVGAGSRRLPPVGAGST